MKIVFSLIVMLISFNLFAISDQQGQKKLELNRNYSIDAINEAGDLAYKLSCSIDSLLCKKSRNNTFIGNIRNPLKLKQVDFNYLGTRELHMSVLELEALR